MPADRLCVGPGTSDVSAAVIDPALVSRGGCKSIADKLSEQCVKELLTHHTSYIPT